MIRHFVWALVVVLGQQLLSAASETTAPESTAPETNNEVIAMVIGFMSDADKDIRALAFEQIRSATPGVEATRRFASELPKLPSEAQVGLLNALADRGDVVAKSTVNDLLTCDDVDVAQAAIGALGKLGDQNDTDTLVALFASHKDRTRSVVANSLVQLRGDNISMQIAESLEDLPVTIQVGLFDVLLHRRAVEVIPKLLVYARGSDPRLRTASMDTLGQLASSEHIPDLVQGVLKAAKGNERNQAERNLMLVCRRAGDRDEQAMPLLDAMRSLSDSDRITLLPALGRVGGRAAWDEVTRAIRSRDRALHHAGIRAISNWPDASAAPKLKEIVSRDAHPDHQRIARMTLLRIAPLPDGRTDEDKLALLQEAMQLAKKGKERNYGLQRASAIRLVETLRFVMPYVEQPEYAEQACLSIVELAHDRGLRDSHKEEFHAALDTVLATTSKSVVAERARRYKKGQTWVRPSK